GIGVPVAVDVLVLLRPVAHRGEEHGVEQPLLVLGQRVAIGAQLVHEGLNLSLGGTGRRACHSLLRMRVVLGGRANGAGGAGMPAAELVRRVANSAPTQNTRLATGARYPKMGTFRVPHADGMMARDSLDW